jgi:Peptidase propeptide and YPEB domain
MRAWQIGWSCAVVLLAGMIATAPQTGANHQPRATPSATPVVGSPLLQPTIDLVEAQKIALKGQAGAHVAEIDLDGKAGVLTYRIALDNGIDVEVDATTGESVGTERDEHPGEVTAARQGGDDNEAPAARRGHHDGDDRSARRGDRDDDDKRAHRGHHDNDDRSARRGHHHHDDDVKVTRRGHGEPASTQIMPREPRRERVVGER